MSPDPSRARIERLLGGFRLEEPPPDGAVRGCGLARSESGERAFVRWSASEGDDAAWKALEAEHAALRAIADDGVPRPLALRREGGFAALVTTFVPDARRLGDAAVDAESVAAQLVRILRRTHAAGLVHGDLKPANLLVDPDGRVHVVDWELVRPAGEAAAPGTLGWAPPSAWDECYVANPWNDWYSAAVVLWEHVAGTRAFDGSRDEIVAAQGRFAFPRLDAERYPTVAAVVGAALTRGTPAVPGSAAAAAFDAPRAAFGALARLLAPIDAAAIASESVECAVPPSAAAAVVEGAVAQRVAGLGASLAATWSDVRPALDRAATLDADGAGGGRAAWAAVATVLARRWAGAGPVVLVGAAGPGEPPVEATLQRFAGLVRRLADGVDLRVLVVRTQPDPRLDPVWLRALAAQKLGVPEPPAALVRVLGDAGPWTGADAGSWIDEAVARGDLRPDGTSWRALTHAWSRTPAPAVASDDDQAAESWVRRAEQCLLAGVVADAYRAAVRATTMLEREAPDASAAWMRLSDLWAECGQPEAARAALARIGDGADREQVLLRLSRLAAAGGRPDEIASVAAALHLVAQGPDATVSAHRLDAVHALTRSRVGEAFGALRRARRARRSAAARTQVEYAMTLGNTLRVAGRESRARRIFAGAARRAHALGAVRIGVQCELNRLLSERDQPVAARAQAWESLARFAESWGFASPSEYATALAAVLWLERHEFERADRLSGCALGRSRAAAGGTSRSRYLLDVVAAACADRREDYSGLLGPIEDGDAMGPRGLLRLLHRRELGLAGTHELLRALRGARLPAMRTVRCVVRALGRRSRAPSRALAAVRAARARAVLGSGFVEHALRGFAAWGGRIPDVLRGLRADAPEDAHAKDLALAAHALVLGPLGHADREAAEWFRLEAPWDPAARPPGVREWEWMAALVATGVRGARGEQAPRLLAAAAAHLDRVGARCAPGHLAAVRARSVEVASLSAHGFAGADVPAALRAMSERIVSASTLRDRDSGSRAVLRCALRLRASTSVDDVLVEIVRGVLTVCPAERAVVIYDRPGAGTSAKVGTLAGERDLTGEDAEVSQSVLARVRDADHAVVIDDVAAEALLGDRPSVRKYRPRSVMACPLRASGRYLGFMYVENRSRPGCFAGIDTDVLEAFAAQAALALENATLVDDLRTSYAEVSRARSEAVRAESLRALGRLASEVAHDLNNLLTAIMGESQLLLSDPRFDDAYQGLRVIERAAQDGAECIRRIQDSTRQKAIVDLAEIDLVALLREVVELNRVRCSAAFRGDGRAIETHCETPARALVRGVASELREVFTNLVVNAIDAMPDGGALRVAVRRAQDAWVVDVADTGCGIPPDVLPRLFEPFFTTKGDRGNGLGLSIARGVVQRLGGEIRVESEVGRGTCVSVELPRVVGDVVLPASAEPAPAERAPEPARREEPPARFLIVDDDPSVLRVLGQMLEQSGVRVEAVVGGDAALAKLDRTGEPYSCVITDLYMPAVSGLDVASAVRRRHPLTRVVVMSGCATTLETTCGPERGVTEILRKPFTLEAVRKLARS